MSIALFTQIAGLGLQAAGGALDTSIKSKLYRRQAKSLMNDAKTVEQETDLSLDQYWREAEAAMSSQRAGYAKSGVELSSGSPLEVLADSAGQAELDANIIKWKGDTEAVNLRNQAKISRYNARMAKITGFLNTFNSILGSGGSSALSGMSFTGSSSGNSKYGATSANIGLGRQA